ncbi:HNH endonuclease [Ruegeria sp.]|uniref:HNH endonuclease n=1 Tax=Ruegeria sp. TaxID=1879320 RepID=UPI00231096A9|nr:HNH endonuclease [Ruegeria sp.]MDA7967294.1 HNH endonuclease [Ruegeria sp.]
MESWESVAQRLDQLYLKRPEIASKQLKNQPNLLVLENTIHGFFPIRRLADGREERLMDLPKCKAQEAARYSSDLRSVGFQPIRPNDTRHSGLIQQLTNLLHEKYQTNPSRSEKTFWIRSYSLKEKVLKAFETFDRYGVPDGFREARTWYVSHPETGEPYPAKAIWGLATDQKSDEFISHQARDGLRKAGFECADLNGNPPIDVSPEPLFEGAERQFTRSARERNQVARKLCLEHYSSNGRVTCIACELDFAETYGPIGDGFIHVHHLDPLAEAEGSRNVSPEFDLVPVCPNCHAMIHRGGQNRSIDEIRDLLAANSRQNR